jgi:hypothetical protein
MRHPGPPPASGPTPAWTTKANDFAAYFCLTVHYPWDLVTGAPSVPLTYRSLLTWMAELRESGDNNDLCQHCWLVQLGTSLRVNGRIRNWMNRYRSRSATVWGANDPPPHNQQHEHDPDDPEPVARGLDGADAVRTCVS